MIGLARVLLTALVVLLVVGVAPSAQAGRDHPVGIRGVEEFTSTWSSEPDDRCSPMGPGMVSSALNFEGVGQVSHLGRITFEGYHCLQLRDLTMTGDVAIVTWAFVDGGNTWTAANGDEVWLADDDLTSVWSVDPASLGGDLIVLDTATVGTVEIIGGTGRFTEATGFVDIDAPHQDGPLTLTGEITYDASNRSAR